jgi:type II secretory pathway component GspD/PulD (secretin)/tetratricopeptide (TPR) repeat protein
LHGFTKEKEQVRFMKITQNCEHLKQKETKLTKVWSFGGRSETFASFVIFCSILLSPPALAQNADNIAEREVQRRQAAIPQGEAALARGQAAMRAKNYTVAYQEFKTAIAYLPDAVVSGRAHDEAAEGVCKSGTVLAEARIAQGDYAGAEALLNEILNRYDPNCRKAQELYAHLRQPGYFNKTVDASFINKVEEVKRLLAEADGFYQSGQYDKAMKSYDRVLALDPYNTAARRGQERIDNTKYQYGEEAYDETRARQMWKVEEAWQQPVRKYGAVGPAADNKGRGVEMRGTAQMTNRLNSIIIPHIEFRDTTIREAIDFLREQAAENDPSGNGVNIVLRLVPLGQIAPPSAPGLPPEGAAPPEGTAAPGVGAPPAGAAAPPVGAPARGRPGAPPVPAPVSGPAAARITVTLDNIPLGEALRYVANQAGLKIKVEPYAVALIPLSEQSNDLITKRYHVPPEFFGGPLDVGYYIGTNVAGTQTGAGTTTGVREAPPVAEKVIEQQAISFQSSAGIGGGAGAASQANAVQGTASTRQTLLNDRQLVGRADAITMLESMGVQFPKGASASFWPHSGTLIVRNTQDNLDMVDALVDQANASQPKQVSIESKFVEINQNNLKELGFDWLLGPFSTNGKVFGAGGNVPLTSPGSFPFQQQVGTNPTTGLPIIGPIGGPGTSIPGDGTSGGGVTSGNRSGGFAISANAIDALLGATGAPAVAPGIFGLAGVFTNPQFQVVVRALNQKKGIDLLSAPTVTTKSGQRAIIEVIRELRYPRTYTPPQVPSISGGGTGAATVNIAVVTPTTPQDWETRNTGVTLEAEPVVGGDNTTIDLNLIPQVVEFEGFINYGSPIFGINPNEVSSINTPRILLTDNVINQPVFSTRKVTTSVSVYDGQTVVLGGLMREDVQKTEDRTPIIGDIPLIGRAFRTNVEQHVKKNLVIFVTAKIVTPAGLPLNEEEEGLLPPELPEVPAYKK